MPSTRRQKAKARKSREMDVPSDKGNKDIMLGEVISNSIERELDKVLNGPERHRDAEFVPNRKNSTQ